VTKVRRRVTWELRDRRGRKIDPQWANRRRLLRARERLSARSFAKMWNQISAEDPSAQILSAWIAKEELRTLLSTVRLGGDAHLTRHRLHRFLSWCIDSQIPELLTLASTVDAWWPEIHAFVQTGITNARTEGYNRLIKQFKRVLVNRPSGTRHAGTDRAPRRRGLAGSRIEGGFLLRGGADGTASGFRFDRSSDRGHR
jgi:transposase